MFGPGRFEIWNWRDGSRKLFETLETGAQYMRFSPDGRYNVSRVAGWQRADMECTHRPISEKVDGPMAYILRLVCCRLSKTNVTSLDAFSSYDPYVSILQDDFESNASFYVFSRLRVL